MLATADPISLDRETAPGADALFASYQEQIYRRTDRLFACLMGGQWIAGIVFALVVAPRTWVGAESSTHVHVWAAVFLGGAISLFPALLALLKPGAPVTRYTIASAQMLMGGLLIHLTGGRIETHFHIFGSLAFLAFYRDWRVLVPATIVVALDHFLRGLFWPESVYGVLVPSSWRWLEHAAWVVFEDVFLVMACVRGTKELRKIADDTAVMEEAHKEQAAHAVEKDELIARLRLSQQEVEAATRAKSEFLANMSHELRTPLNAISLYSELLQECAAEEGRNTDVADLTKISNASRHLLGLIDGILDLSKIEAGKMELNLERLDVREMVVDLVSTIDPIVRKQDNTLKVTIAQDVPIMHTDVLKTQQILYNLLSNAAKFTSSGRIALDISRGEISGVPCVEFVITDNGIGLTSDQQGRLFRPFVQADMSIARKYGGTGLGLALVWRFCRLMGGDVRVDSEIGEGARFAVRLPVDVTTPDEQAA
ncbi:MAG TPA: HAMP domain-containing sensor histidine kinase [Vicinamibacterales bacterium]|nr:HAMP domain-containing sensor histidine kinase [Vicinamibacterales bacterium]